MLPSPSFLSGDPPPPPHLPWTPPPTPTQTEKYIQEISKSGPRIMLNASTKMCGEANGMLYVMRKNEHAQTIPYSTTTATDLPTPSLLFSHFTGRHWFPILFFLLHVLIGPHLLLVQQAGSLEFTFLPDKLQRQKKWVIFLISVPFGLKNKQKKR